MTVWNEFKQFALRGNLVDLAVGFTVGAAFTSVARSLVDDLLMPPVGLLLGRSDFSDLYVLLRAGEAAPPPYPTRAAAEAAGAVTLDYGHFINSLLAFAVAALAMFAVMKAINRLDRRLERESGAAETSPEEPANKKCPFCLSTIPVKARRCPQCTSHLDGGPEKPGDRPFTGFEGVPPGT